MWSGSNAKPREEAPEEEAVAMEEAQAAEEAAAAAAAVSAVVEKEGAGQKADEQHATVKDGLRGNEEIKKLRTQCKNTMYVALAIMSEACMQFLVILVLEMSRPFWNEHSSDARSCRDSKGTQAFCMSAAQESHMETVHQCADILMNLTLLSKVGFRTVFGAGIPKTLTVLDQIVQSETAHAHHAFRLF